MTDALAKARKGCLGYGCSRAARCGLYIQRIADTRAIRPWMSSTPGEQCDHWQPAPDLDHPPAQPAALDRGIA